MTWFILDVYSQPCLIAAFLYFYLSHTCVFLRHMLPYWNKMSKCTTAAGRNLACGSKKFSVSENIWL